MAPEAGQGLAVHLVARPLGSLLGKGRPTKSVPQWTAKCRGQLLSAATNGQWPQTRLAAIRGTDDVDDRTCRLCRMHPGTLAHRRCCEATAPVGGWPPVLAQLARVVRLLAVGGGCQPCSLSPAKGDTIAVDTSGGA